MSLNPTSASASPVRFYTHPHENVSKLINDVKVELEQLEEELNSCKPPIPLSLNGRPITVISSGILGNAINSDVTEATLTKIEKIQSSLLLLDLKLDVYTKGFEKILALEINPVNETIMRLNRVASSWHARHLEIWHSQAFTL